MLPCAPPPPIFTGTMSETSPRQELEADLKQLEKSLADLVLTCTQLREENRSLRQRQDTLIAERANLLQKSEQARSRVEAMVGRLKSMEHTA